MAENVIIKSSKNVFIKLKAVSQPEIRLFCFPHAGAGASVFKDWSNHLPPTVEMLAVQLPGRENRFSESLINHMPTIMNQLVEEFNEYRDKPLVVFGHSLGALIGYEFVKAVEDKYDVIPNHLIVSGARAPHLARFREPLSQLDDAILTDVLRRYNGIDNNIIENTELLELFLPIIRNDFSLIENYQYRKLSPLSSDILAFAGEADETVPCEQVEAWSQYTNSNFKFLIFPGGHFFIRSNTPQIMEIINEIALCSLNQIA